jgi:hypothetical protein
MGAQNSTFHSVQSSAACRLIALPVGAVSPARTISVRIDSDVKGTHLTHREMQTDRYLRFRRPQTSVLMTWVESTMHSARWRISAPQAG